MAKITQLGQVGLDSEGYSSHDAEQIAISASRNNYRAALQDKTNSIQGVYEATMNYVRNIHRATKLRMLESYGDVSQLPKNANMISEEQLNQQLAETLIIRLDKKELQRIVGKANNDNKKLSSEVEAARQASKTFFSISNISTTAINIGDNIRNQKNFNVIINNYENFKMAKFMKDHTKGYKKLAKEIDSLLKALPKEELAAKAYAVGVDFEHGIKSNILRHMIVNQCCAYVALITGKAGPEVSATMGGQVVENIKDILRYTTFSWVAGVPAMANATLKNERGLANEMRKFAVSQRGIMQQKQKIANTKARFKDMKTGDSETDKEIKKLQGNIITRNVKLLKFIKNVRRRKKRLSGADQFCKISKKMLEQDGQFQKWVVDALNSLVTLINNKMIKDKESFDIKRYLDIDNELFKDVKDKSPSDIINTWMKTPKLADKILALTDKWFGEDSPARNDDYPNSFLTKFDKSIRDYCAIREYVKYPYDPKVSTMGLIGVYMEKEFAQNMARLRAGAGGTVKSKLGDTFRKIGGVFSRRLRNEQELIESQRALAAGEMVGSSLRLATDQNGDLLLNENGEMISEDAAEKETGNGGIVPYISDDNKMLSSIKKVQPVFIANNSFNSLKLVKVSDGPIDKSAAEYAVPVVIMGSVNKQNLTNQNNDIHDNGTSTDTSDFNIAFADKFRNIREKVLSDMGVEKIDALPPLMQAMIDPKKALSTDLNASADSVDVFKNPQSNRFNTSVKHDALIAANNELNSEEYNKQYAIKESDDGKTFATSDTKYWSKYANKYWPEADAGAKVRPVFIANNYSDTFADMSDYLYNIEGSTSSIFNFLNTQLPTLFMGLQMGGMAVNVAAAGAGASMAVGAIQTAADTALRLQKSGFATGGEFTPRKSTQFISGDSLNYKPNPELVSVDWANQSISVKPVHYTPSTVPRYATGAETAETPHGGNSSRLSLSERNSALDVNIATGVVKYTNQLSGVTDDGTNTAVKVYSINSPLTDKIDVGGTEVSLIELVYGMTTSLNSINSGIQTQTQILSTIASSGVISGVTSPSDSEAGPSTNNFEFPTNLDSILSGE